MNYSFDVLTQINTLRDSFSQAEEALAAYILKDPSNIVNKSITDLAEDSGLSVATISRFCRHLSLNGFPDFKLELMRSLATTDSTSEASCNEITPQDSIPDMVSKMTAHYQQVLQKTSFSVDFASFKRVSDLIETAKDVHFVGTGNMLPVAMAAKLQFMNVSSKFQCNIDSSAQALSTCFMDESSLVIIFAYTGETITATEIAKFARDRGAKVVAITRYSHSKLTELSDEILICSASKSYQQFSSLPFCTGLQFIVDLLYTEYCRRNPSISETNKFKTVGVVVGRL